MDTYNSFTDNSATSPLIIPTWTKSWVGEAPKCSSCTPITPIEVNGETHWGWTTVINNKTYAVYPDTRYIYHCTESSRTETYKK
jgi:hypothetical protein